MIVPETELQPMSRERNSSPETDEGTTIERTSPEAVFELLADDTRVEILRRLGETPDATVSFSDLHERVGTVDSGHFNYHLKKLQGSLVRKTDDGYELTHAGRQIIGAIHAGTYTADATVEPVSTGVECPTCETDLVAEYTDETARIYCECGDPVEYFFPPGGLAGFDREGLPAAFYRWNYLAFQRTLAGFCPLCAGRMDGELVLDGDAPRMTSLAGDSPADTAHFEFECRRCGNTRRPLATSPAMVHPAVGGFLADHGIDVRTDPIWGIRERLDDPRVELLSEEPPRIEVQFSLDEDGIVAVIEDEGSVERVDRTSAAGSNGTVDGRESDG
ncbi:ArsR family transcriptional regulator [Halobacteriales archaeon QH_2_65_14]|nr:MAG: ArsR family transcriptional regulator [Halobacteriales archaeon QH_2_65_14]